MTAPCFYSAAIYYILGQLMQLWGRQYSLLSPRLYLISFATFDLISSVIQATGGATASEASTAEPLKSTDLMMAGIIVQLVSRSIFVILFLWTIWRARHVPRTQRLKLLLAATSISSACIITRNFYRAIEPSQGGKST